MTSIEAFAAKNARLDAIRKERDAACGWRMWFACAVFSFLLVGPVVSLVPMMRGAGPAYVAIELAMIAMIAWCAVEYGHRRAVWFICIARGVCVTFEKTEGFRAWATRAPMTFAIVFVALHGFITYLGLDPTLSKGELADILLAVLSILAVMFVLLMTKNLCDIEGANALLTVPMFVYFFDDDDILVERGFATVSFAVLAKYVLIDRKDEKMALQKFSWNEIHALHGESANTDGDSAYRRPTLIDGIRLVAFLKIYKDLESLHALR